MVLLQTLTRNKLPDRHPPPTAHQWLTLTLCYDDCVQDLLDPEKGYIKDDAIVLEVQVVADAPHGVR